MASTETPIEDSRTDYGSTLLPKSKLFWTGLSVSALLLVGAMLVTGPMAAIMGVWGLTTLGGSLAGYVVYRVWYHRGT